MNPNRLLVSLLLAVTCLGAHAQAYPNRVIRIIEPAGPGSAVDVFARQLGPLLAQALGQSVIIDNKPGANSGIGAREAARSAPDGYTLFHGNINNSLNDLLTDDACCRLNEALVPVARLTVTPLVMVVHPSVSAKDLEAYIALAKAQPQLVTMASSGPGSITQLVGEKFKLAAGVNAREIPYKAIGAELPDLLAGHVMTAFLSPVVIKQYVQTGRLRALGVASSHRLAILPDVPTLAEAGLAGVEASGWNGLFVPAGTPKAVVDRLAAETAKVLASAAIKADAVTSGYELDAAGPDEFGAFVRAEIVKWRKVIKDSNIKLER
ncbi:MAG: tripartite tricarboxylate transporter substrate binding protein [Caldimonas sp.]